MWTDDQMSLLLKAIAMSLRNEVTIMVALIATVDIVPLEEKTDLRLRTQQTIELLDKIDAAFGDAMSAAADEPERKPPEPPYGATRR
jgi:hypothetical protein